MRLFPGHPPAGRLRNPSLERMKKVLNNFHRRVTRKGRSMVIDMCPRFSLGREGMNGGMHPCLKNLPKPPDAMSAGRNLRIYRQKSSFQSACNGAPFPRFSAGLFRLKGEIVTRLPHLFYAPLFCSAGFPGSALPSLSRAG